jgi:hypothetical protein
MKNHNAINYHSVQDKAAAAEIIRIGKEDSKTNAADLLTKLLSTGQKRCWDICWHLLLCGSQTRQETHENGSETTSNWKRVTRNANKVTRPPESTVDRWPNIGFHIYFAFNLFHGEDIHLRVGGF